MNIDDYMKHELMTQDKRLEYIRTLIAGDTCCSFPPRRVYIEPTNNCTLRCKHCAHYSHMIRDKGYMDMSLFKKIIKDLEGLHWTTKINLFQQGESLLHKDLPEMISHCSKDYFVKLNTNITLLDKALSEKIMRAGLDHLQCSLDAISPETFYNIKGSKNFLGVLDNLLDYLELWGDIDIRTNQIDVSMLVQEENEHEVETFNTMMDKLPFGHVDTYPLHNFMGAIKEANELYPERHQVDTKQYPGCCVPWEVVAIRWNGDVVACFCDYDSRYVIGNVRNESLRDIWNSPRMQEFRRAVFTRDYSRIEENGPLCSVCTIMWQPGYGIPTDFHKELARMEYYLSACVHRVVQQFDRREKGLVKHKYLKEHRQEWIDELLRTGEALNRAKAEKRS